MVGTKHNLKKLQLMQLIKSNGSENTKTIYNGSPHFKKNLKIQSHRNYQVI